MKKNSELKTNPKNGKSKTTAGLKNKTANNKNVPTEKVKRILEIESFNLGNMIREARVFKNLTQEDLAKKSETTKHYISRIENNGSDIRLKTLMRIVKNGLGGILKFSVDFDD